MPKFETSESLFFGLLGKTISDGEIERIFPRAKAELDEHDVEGKSYKFELNDTNRPDLWSAAGLARALKTYEAGKPNKYGFFSSATETKKAGYTMVCHKEAENVRPYSIGFAAKGCKVTEDILLALISSQEKLCSNFGRKRKTIALGIYRSDLITFPVHYTAADPDKTHFIPLGLEEDLTLRQICEKHPKGIEYGKIVSDSPVFPYLHDDAGKTLSFPPVINSAHLGAVKVGDENLFIECSGTNLRNLILTCSILACDMADMGFEIVPVKVSFEKATEFGTEITVPYYYQSEAKCTKQILSKVSGLELDDAEIKASLLRMGIESEIAGNEITIKCPEYRDDFLHAVDVVEDVIIGHGLENYEPEMPSDFTIGRLSPAEELSRKVKKILVGLGFQEMIYNYLGSKKEYADRMNIDDSAMIHIANPMSENYEVVRPSIIPCLLESEAASGHATYPHSIFEVGKVAFLDPSDNSGTRTINSLGFFSSDSRMGFNEASAYVNTLMYFLGFEYSLTEAENDPRFIEGRCANVIVNGQNIGVFGEINPQVLENWGCNMPSVACELNLDCLL